MGFQDIANSITAYFQDVADVNNLIVRYDNDPRATPISALWCKVLIDFDDSQQKEIGINSYRNIGNFIIEIKNSIGLGLSELLEKADLIANSFRSVDVGNIVFRVPKIKRRGRIEDDYQVDVVCPFYVDNVGN